jgi:N-acetylneuraminic acid mutarotase
MRKTSILLWLLLLAGCSGSSSELGSVRFAVSVPEAFASSVSRVSVTASGADLPSVSVELALSEGVWSGQLDNLPAGTQRSFLAEAFDSAGIRLLAGSASDIAISAEHTPLVSMTLRQLNPPLSLNQAPVIDALEASGLSVPAGGMLSFAATAHDPDPADMLSYAWSSPVGAFSSASAASTSWKAPVFLGTQSVVLTVTDSRGRSSSRTLAVAVTSSAPVIVHAGPSLLTVSPGQELIFSAEAGDPLGSALSFSWTTTSGSLGTAESGATHSRISWTAPYCGTAGTSPTVTVIVTNGSGLTAGKRLFARGLPACPTVGWTAGLSMRSPRVGHTATRLPDGQVLVMGGYGTDTILRTAEVYDPVKGTWRLTDEMRWSRQDHSATRLPNGQVLVTGGHNSGGRLKAAEVYDPEMGTWSATGEMSVPRFGHTATLLLDGRVLVTGGFVETAEVYDPATGTWSTAGAMNASRSGHTATLLPDGRVLVAGGYNLGTAEVYDPATGTWSVTGAMRSRRNQHTAVPLPNGQVLVAGGHDSTNHLTTAEVYDPATGTWKAVASLAFPRSSHAAVPLPNGQVLVAGGHASRGDPATAEVYDPATETWKAVASMTSHRYDSTATVLPNGRVLITGGGSDTGALSTTEVYVHPR